MNTIQLITINLLLSTLVFLLLKTARCGEQQGYFQYANVPAPGQYEFGYNRGNPNHYTSRYEQSKDWKFRAKVRWGDKSGGYGEHYFDYNHVDKNKGKHNEDEVQHYYQQQPLIEHIPQHYQGWSASAPSTTSNYHKRSYSEPIKAVVRPNFEMSNDNYNRRFIQIENNKRQKHYQALYEPSNVEYRQQQAAGIVYNNRQHGPQVLYNDQQQYRQQNPTAVANQFSHRRRPTMNEQQLQHRHGLLLPPNNSNNRQIRPNSRRSAFRRLFSWG